MKSITIPIEVHEKSRSPYDFILWFCILLEFKKYGSCDLGTEKLAANARMSVGKVSECRKYLLDCGLIEGELEKEFGDPYPVWHLRIPESLLI